MAASIVRPRTNCSPMMRMAWPTAARMTGSPRRPASFLTKPGRSFLASSSGSTILPVSIRPQVEALTNRLSLPPRWLAQSAEPIFSAISLSRVSSSGVRSRASARHISARPSRVPRLNSCRKLSTTPCLRTLRRAPRTRASASARTAARSSLESGLAARRSAITAASSRYLPSSRLSQWAKSVMVGPVVLDIVGLTCLPAKVLRLWRGYAVSSSAKAPKMIVRSSVLTRAPTSARKHALGRGGRKWGGRKGRLLGEFRAPSSLARRPVRGRGASVACVPPLRLGRFRRAPFRRGRARGGVGTIGGLTLSSPNVLRLSRLISEASSMKDRYGHFCSG